MNLKGLFFVLLFFNALDVKASDYMSSGFCVPLGEKVLVENAVVKVRSLMINNSLPLPIYFQGHKFFDFTDGAARLLTTDKGGEFILVKPSSEVIVGKKIAILSDFTDHNNLKKTILVECKEYPDDDTTGDPCIHECGRRCYEDSRFCGMW